MAQDELPDHPQSIIPRLCRILRPAKPATRSLGQVAFPKYQLWLRLPFSQIP
jgi:hypothetical protein